MFFLRKNMKKHEKRKSFSQGEKDEKEKVKNKYKVKKTMCGFFWKIKNRATFFFYLEKTHKSKRKIPLVSNKRLPLVVLVFFSPKRNTLWCWCFSQNEKHQRREWDLNPRHMDYDPIVLTTKLSRLCSNLQGSLPFFGSFFYPKKQKKTEGCLLFCW